MKTEKQFKNSRNRMNLYGLRYKTKTTKRSWWAVYWTQEVIEMIKKYVAEHSHTAKSFAFFVEVSALITHEILTQHPKWTLYDLARVYIEQIPLTITLNHPDKSAENYELNLGYSGKTLGQFAWENYESNLEKNVGGKKLNWAMVPIETQNAWEEMARNIRRLKA